MEKTNYKKPIYQIIEDDLRKSIVSGELKQGDLVPSETELASKYQVTRMTVRQAINNLLVDGYIYRHKGRGTFVTFNKMEIEENSHYYNYLKGLKEKGLRDQIKTVLINKNIIEADEIISVRLQTKIKDPVYYVERLQVAGSIVLSFERLYIPLNMFPKISEFDFTNSFYDYIEKENNLKIRSYNISIESRGLTSRVADLLHHKEGEPSLYMCCETILDNGRVFEYKRCYLNASYFRFKYNGQ